MNKILIIEDDPAVSKGLEISLRKENFETLISSDGEKGFLTALKVKPEMILLDIMLPGKNGFDICKNLRLSGHNFPIIMLSAKAEEADKVIGLELGADDYITKPFSIRELVARIKAILRRRSVIKNDFDKFIFDDVTLDFAKMEAYKGDHKIEMSLKEYEIMKYFIGHEDSVVSRNDLLNEVWGYDSFPTTRTVDNYILILRKKIETNPSRPKHIITYHSVGYKFVK
ncbi:MAG TPA: response regulator transcription factor [Ignavibacteria bacterium]|nr:response regulator transcription factor [Ignavibacteria bacterium]HRJ99919.1 response regulator transcription factor [Ignavibacteria bacterium]